MQVRPNCSRAVHVDFTYRPCLCMDIDNSRGYLGTCLLMKPDTGGVRPRLCAIGIMRFYGALIPVHVHVQTARCSRGSRHAISASDHTARKPTSATVLECMFTLTAEGATF
jgi:hypothetical protein